MKALKSRSAANVDAPPARALSLRDTFQDDRKPGAVRETRASDGTPRRVTDAEGTVSIDHGALRIAPLARSGWGRAGIAYGPYEPRPGLVLAALVLNSHQNAQSYQLKTVTRQLIRWCAGSRADGVGARAWGILTARKREPFRRRLRGWMGALREVPPITESLALGFAHSVTIDPEASAPAFAVRAAGGDNGTLLARIAGRSTPVLRGLPDLPLYLLIALRDGSAVYYLASVEGGRGCVGLPQMRPIAIDPSPARSPLFAALAQSVMAEIGFSIDTRVQAIAIDEIAEHAPWCGAAHAADDLRGNGPLHESDAQRAGMWRCVLGSFTRYTEGAASSAGESLALLEAPQPSGLLHTLVRAGDGEGGLVFRAHDGSNFWRVTAGAERSRLIVRERGKDEVVATAPGVGPASAEAASVQVSDDGRSMEVIVNGVPLAGPLRDPRLGGARSIGVWASGAITMPTVLSRFEAHPRRIEIPRALDLGRPWNAEGTRVLVHDDFRGPVADLAARTTPVGGKRWTREAGRGRMLTTGTGAARVDASVGTPSPGRTIYAIDWDEPALADVEVEITPPGTGPGQAQRCRAGLVFWQDRRNQILMNIWLDEAYPSASLSCFFRKDGYEDTYDAVWTNLGDRVRWGRPLNLRVACDGNHYMARVDGEPILYRAFTDVFSWARGLQVRKIGLLANWEWGTDTGTVIRNFTVRGR